MNGSLVIDKPQGPTSHDVVAIVRRAVGIDRVGHTGTLDPLATGVLVLLLGKATRLASFMTGADKEYVAGVRLGVSTDTYDAEGTPSGAASGGESALPDEAAVVGELAGFRGSFLQMPPRFSAKKVRGTAAYKLARQQKVVELEPVLVTVREIELRGYVGDLAELRLVCSSGFYVRSLAHDLGQRLGCGAHLAALRRTRAGQFSIEDATSLATVQSEGAAATSRLIPMDRLLPHLPAVVVNTGGAKRIGHGLPVGPDDIVRSTPDAPVTGAEAGSAAETRVRLLDGSSTLLAIAERRGGLLHPTVVLM